MKYSEFLYALEDDVDDTAELAHDPDAGVEDPDYVLKQLYKIKQLIHKLARQVEASEEDGP